MFSLKVHRNIYLGCIWALTCCILLGRAPGSFPIIALAANWLLEGRWKYKLTAITSTPLLWILSSLFFLSLFGLIYTSDTDSALNTIRINLPLLALPLILLSSDPISKKEMNLGLYAFLLGCFVNTAWCLLYSFVLHSNEELRDASRFISHIRLGLFINLAIATCVYFFTQFTTIKFRLLIALLALYFIGVLFLLGLASGIVNFFILLFIAFLYVIFNQKLPVKITALALLVISLFLIARYFLRIKDEQLLLVDSAYNQSVGQNKSGRPLIHFNSLRQKENGNYILINLQLEDLRKTWNSRVPQDSFSYAPQHNLQRYDVLLRYLSSKTLNKDAEGVLALTADDIQNIRRGIPNYLYPRWTYLRKRIYELVNEYDDYINHRDVNGHSLTMRLYYWQAAIEILIANPVFGVGTGDGQMELNKVYASKFPWLKSDWYKRPHNQYLSILVSYGCLGFVLFMFVLIYPILALRKQLPYLYRVFFILLTVSFLTEDTLDSQAGMGFYAIFNTLFCSVAWFKRQQTPED